MKQRHGVAGAIECGITAPVANSRVYYRRARTGMGCLYLYRTKEYSEKNKMLGRSNSNDAFGWIPQEHAIHIRLPALEGWCNYNKGDDTITFTDDIEWDGSNRYGDAFAVEMWAKAHQTNFARQNQFWLTKTPSNIGQQPAAQAASQKENEMAYNGGSQGSSVGSKVSVVIDRNKSAAQTAAYLEAGRIANNQVTKLASKALPMMVRGYADTPAGKIVAANLVQAVVAQFRPTDARLVKLGDAMAASAFQELYASFDVEGFLDNLLSSDGIKRALDKIDGQAD